MVQFDMATLFVRCEKDWCALLQTSHTNDLYGITTAPKPYLFTFAARVE